MCNKWNNKNSNKIINYTSIDGIKRLLHIFVHYEQFIALKQPVTCLLPTRSSCCYVKGQIPRNDIFLRFNNLETKGTKKGRNVAPTGNVFESFIWNCKKSLNPCTYLYVDEPCRFCTSAFQNINQQQTWNIQHKDVGSFKLWQFLYIKLTGYYLFHVNKEMGPKVIEV